MLGVVGRTGSGKTTLTRTPPALLRSLCGRGAPGRSGSAGGQPGGDTRAPWPGHPGGGDLFNASVRDNLTLFDDDVPDDRIRAVLDTLGFAGWLRALPQGLDTLLGPDGGGLSAGQAQVLACARIFLRDPDVVILDEASSRSLPATERLVHSALGRSARRPYRDHRGPSPGHRRLRRRHPGPGGRAGARVWAATRPSPPIPPRALPSCCGSPRRRSPYEAAP